MEGSDTQRRKQKRMRIMSKKEKFQKRNQNKHFQCILTSTHQKNDNEIPFFVNQKMYHHVVFVEVMRVVKINPTVINKINIEETTVNTL